MRILPSDLAQRVLAFAAISGTGLALDVCLYAALQSLGWRAGLANALSASAAVTFVYFASVSRVFSYRGGFLYSLFLVYVVYQLVAVALASWAVDVLVAAVASPLLAKALTVPVTFSMNYVFMQHLTKARS